MNEQEYKKYIDSLIEKKEFRELLINTKTIDEIAEIYYEKNKNQYYKSDYIKPLELRPLQKFVSKILNIFSKNKRLLIKSGTGTGKTITAINDSKQFIQLYKDQYVPYGHKQTPSVVFIGFTKEVIMRDLKKYPEFGILSHTEIQILNNLKIQKNTTKREEDIENYNKFNNLIKKRIISKENGGFYKFYGYKEFANRMFGDDFQKIIDNTDIDIKNGMNINIIKKLIAENKLIINESLIESLRYSLIICDEIHNAYNSKEHNMYGIALELLFNKLKDDVWVLLMSATVLNSSPTEIIDLYNMLLILDKQLEKKDYFNLNNENSDISITDDKIKELGQLSIGHVVFLPSVGENYPKKIFEGEQIEGIKFIKFNRCLMSKLQWNTYKQFMDKKISFNDILINDIVFPNPNDDKIGLCNINYISILQGADENWKNKNNIKIENDILVGDFYHKDNLIKYSSKYTELINEINLILANKNNRNGKTLIYHKYIPNGIQIIEQVLLANGIIKYNSVPNDSTLCSKCGNEMKKHKKFDHEFIPATFITISYEITNINVRNELIDEFNSIDNIFGDNIKFIVGSNIIIESIDFNCIVNLITTKRPGPITKLIQWYGRGSRLNSSILLPQEKQKCHIVHLVSSVPDKKILSHDEIGYIKKMNNYYTIQLLMKEQNIYAINNFINYNEFSQYIEEDSIEVLHYKPIYMPTKPTKELDLITFNAYDYNKMEINELIILIKRIFLLNSAWSYDDLLNMCKNPPFQIYKDNSLISVDNFNIALNYLIGDITFKEDYDPITSILNNTSKILIKDNNPYKITHINFSDIEFPKNIKSSLIPTFTDIYILLEYNNNKINIDVNSFINNSKNTDIIKIQIPNDYNNNYSYKLVTDYINKEYKLGNITENSYIKYVNENFHYNLLELIVTNDKSLSLINVNLMQLIINFYNKFDVLIYSNNNIIGYRAQKYNKYYEGGKWYDEIRKFEKREENPILVGFIDNEHFKFRKPIYKLINHNKEDKIDYRKLERGMVCTSYTKEKIKKIILDLGIDIKNIPSKSTNYCDLIMNKLIDLELESRKNNGKIYFYLFNDIKPKM